MAVTIDAISNSGTTNTVASKSWSHTATGVNRLVLVAVQWNQPSNTETVSSVTYDGVAMTQVGSNVIAGGSGLDRCTALFRLIAPATGTKTIVVTMSTALTFFAGAVSFTGVSQATPLGTPQTVTTATAATLSTTTSSSAADLVFSVATVRTSSTLTVPTASQWNALIGATNRYGAAVQAGSASVASTYSWTGADNASMMAVDVLSATTLSQPAKASIFGTAISTLTDDFATASTVKWRSEDGTGPWPAEATVVSGKLNIGVALSYPGLESVNTYDLRNGSSVIQVVQLPSQAGNHTTELHFGVRADASNYYAAVINGNGNIVWRNLVAGVAGTTGYTAYNLATMAWMRWRHAGPSVVLEVASGASGPWTTLATYPVNIPLAAVRSYVMAGYYGTETSPGTAIVDNYNTSGSTKTQPASARIVASRSKQQSAKATIIRDATFAIEGLAFSGNPIRQIPAIARIIAAGSKSLPASAHIIVTPSPNDVTIRPIVGSVAEDIYERLGPYRTEDEAYGWPLLRFCEAICSTAQWTDDLVRDTDNGPGWSGIVDLDRVPDEGLPWLAQFVGVDTIPELDPESQRIRIRETAGSRRGTRASIEGAARQYLTGGRTVVVQERDTSPYHLKVTTFETETPYPDKVAGALKAEKPAGLVLEFVVSTGATYNALKATGMTYDELKATYPTAKLMKLAIIV